MDKLRLKIAGYVFTGAEFDDMCKKLEIDEATAKYCIDNPFGEGIVVNKLKHGIYNYSEWQVGIDDFIEAYGKDEY